MGLTVLPLARQRQSEGQIRGRGAERREGSGGSAGQAIASVSFSLETAGVPLTSVLVGGSVRLLQPLTTKTLTLNMTGELVVLPRQGQPLVWLKS